MKKDKPYKVINGDSLKVLDTLEENSITSIITDPPYGLTTITKRFGKENAAPAKQGKDGSFARLSKGFMGKEWDGSGIEYNVELWEKALRVLKPGGYLLAFGGSRTFHRIACAIEDAGFEVRDTIMWLYGSGFPKSLNLGLAIDKKNGVESKVIGKGKSGSSSHAFQSVATTTAGDFEIKQAQNEWSGWGTALKPAYEPIIVARKPFKGSLIDNILENGVGGINIDECRVSYNGEKPNIGGRGKHDRGEGYGFKPMGDDASANEIGRFPANVILTYDETDFDEVCGGMPTTKSSGSEPNYEFGNQDNPSHLYTNIKSGVHFEDEGNACRYFYCAKASKKDRDNGLIAFEEKQVGSLAGGDNDKEELDDVSQRFRTKKKNIHPTVKPVELMQYLVRLVTPQGGVILDIFNGSGSTGKAVMFENRERNADYKYIGIELDPEYCQISEARIDYALNKFKYDILEEIAENNEKGQMSLFDFMEKGETE